MGELMPIDTSECVRAVEQGGRLILTPHPILLDGQKNVAAHLVEGETLYSFLARHVDPSEPWEVRIGGVVVPCEHWSRIKPKDGQVIEVRGAVNRQALMLVAFIALNYFTFGVGSVVGIGGAFAGAGAYVAAGAMYVAGAMLINKVLAPKIPKAQDTSRDSVHSIAAARNSIRLYEPFALLLGNNLRITPDYASLPYTWYEGDDMYLGMVLNVGINVHDVGPIYNGDTLLSSFDGVQVYYSGIPGKPNQKIPLYSNADTIDGGALDKSTAWVQRTTPDDTVRIQINIEGSIGDRDSKGRDHPNSEMIESQYRPVGTSNWIPLVSRNISNAGDKNFEIQRVTMSRDLAAGQYDVRVRRLYNAKDPDKGNWSAASEFQWTNMVAVQADNADYAGFGRIGIRVKATGQLTGAMDQLRMDALSRPIPVWTGAAWVTEQTSNPGALILQWARGIEDENGKLVAGLGLTEPEIDVEALQAFMVHCDAEGYTYDHHLKDPRSNTEQLDAMAMAGFGAISWETGKLGVVWAASAQPLSGVVNMATIKKGQFQVDYTLVNAADGVEYSYVDRSDWSVKTLRVPAPGITTMLNPAQVQGEGVTTEDHAAQLARWHLAQSLYQYKDISFSTDLENLSYKRMDLLALQHDLTQWGYGGRLVAVDGNTVTLDEPVPANASGPEYIGIRVPGEAVYRVIPVATFTGETDTLTLAQPWPADAPVPGPDNPAHDYIWVYDFKSTPGYRVRVVGKEMESDAKGARIMVVPEGPEFWTYVKTGEYTPATGQSLLKTLPNASNARVSEVQVVQGDTVYTELVVLWDIKGHAARTVVFAGLSGGEMRPVAETVTNQARFRIGSAGTYTILVRPYSVDGIPGQAATVTYGTVATDIPPPPFDWFTVTVEPGGLRRYAWGYNLVQPADLAGAEIRFIAGTVAEPDWDAMTPIGEDGFFTSAFESDIPPSGEWTFAARARNTSGFLSGMVVAQETLASNVGENIEDHEDRITSTREIADQMLADFAAMEQRTDALEAEINVLAGQLGDIMDADVHDPANEYLAGDLVQSGDPAKLYRALQDVPANTPITDTAYWQLMGEYASLGEAVAANLQETLVHASELEAHGQSLSLLGAKNAAGTAFVLNQNTAMVSPTETLAQWRSGISASLAGKASSTTVQEISNTVTQQGDTISAHGTQLSGLSASVGDAEASINELWEVTASSGSGNAAINPSFETDIGWGAIRGSNSPPSGVYYWGYANARTGGRVLRFDDNGTVYNGSLVPVMNSGSVRYGVTWRTAPTAANNGTEVVIYLQGYDSAGNTVAGTLFGKVASVSGVSNWAWLEDTYTVPAGVTHVGMLVRVRNRTSGGVLIDDAYINPVSNVLADVLARYTLAVQAGGDVAGMQLLAGGGISAIRFLANSFQIVDPGGTARTEYSAGTWTVHDSAGRLRMKWGVW